jgi:hypothetical protein
VSLLRRCLTADSRADGDVSAHERAKASGVSPPPPANASDELSPL